MIFKLIWNHRYNLQLESVIKPTLIHLLQNGVTREDIIDINKIFTDFANNTFFLDSQSESDKNITSHYQTQRQNRGLEAIHRQTKRAKRYQFSDKGTEKKTGRNGKTCISFMAPEAENGYIP